MARGHAVRCAGGRPCHASSQQEHTQVLSLLRLSIHCCCRCDGSTRNKKCVMLRCFANEEVQTLQVTLASAPWQDCSVCVGLVDLGIRRAVWSYGLWYWRPYAVSERRHGRSHWRVHRGTCSGLGPVPPLFFCLRGFCRWYLGTKLRIRREHFHKLHELRGRPSTQWSRRPAMACDACRRLLFLWLLSGRPSFTRGGCLFEEACTGGATNTSESVRRHLAGRATTRRSCERLRNGQPAWAPSHELVKRALGRTRAPSRELWRTRKTLEMAPREVSRAPHKHQDWSNREPSPSLHTQTSIATRVAGLGWAYA